MDHQLQLSLALPSHGGFDLNTSYVCERIDHHESIMDNKKRCFVKAFDHDVPTNSTLPLMLWNNDPNEEDDRPPRDGLGTNSFLPINEMGNGLAGWPPVHSWRKKLLLSVQNGGGREGAENYDQTVVIGLRRSLSNLDSMYVKVKMEGVGIARKVDLSLHHGFETLINMLMDMFDEENSDKYRLAYQDREGDWLLVDEHLPWRDFIRNVQRLKLLRSY